LIFNLAINNDQAEHPLVKMLDRKKFNIIKINDLLKVGENKIIIVDCNTSLESISSIISLLNKNEINTFIFLPRHLQEIKISTIYKKIFYPINISKFENILSAGLMENKFISSFKSVSLGYDNFIFNKNNNKKTHVTETELGIIKILFKNKIVEKKKLKTDILEIQSTINTKSLESHLSRIRKKFQQIESDISINSIDIERIKIS